jgi:hypothetical protein
LLIDDAKNAARISQFEEAAAFSMISATSRGFETLSHFRQFINHQINAQV